MLVARNELLNSPTEQSKGNLLLQCDYLCIKGEVMGQYGENIVTDTCSCEVTSKFGLKEAINPEYDSPAPFPGF